MSLGEAAKKARGGLLGAEPLNCSIGPAISVGIGAGGYMDLLYACNPPDAYPIRSSHSKDTIAGSRKGDRGRTLYGWHELWPTIAKWVCEHDSTMIKRGRYSTHSFQYHLDEQAREPRNVL